MQPIRSFVVLGSILFASSACTARADDGPSFDEALIKFLADGVSREIGAGSSDRTMGLVASDFFEQHVASHLSEVDLKRKDALVQAAVASLKDGRSSKAKVEERVVLTPNQNRKLVALFRQINASLKAGHDGEAVLADPSRRKQAILDWIHGLKPLEHGDFLSEFTALMQRDAPPTPEELASLEARVAEAVDSDQAATPTSDPEILDTDAKKAEAKSYLTRADAALRDVIPAGPDSGDEPITADQRKSKLLRWVKGEIKGDKFFLDLLSKMAGRPIQEVPAKDLSTLQAMITEIVGKPNDTPSPLAHGAGLAEVVTVIDDVAVILGYPGISDFVTLFGDVEALVQSSGFANLFRGCRMSRGLRVAPSRSRYVIVEP